VAYQFQIERERGIKEAPQQLSVLREKWPVAFPVKDQDVRPLAIGAASEIATAMGWSLPFTLGVLGRWKMASVDCQAVLCMTNALPLTARRPNRSAPRRRTWRPSNWHGSRRARPRRKPQRLRRPPQ
jgi:hypothetical protein